MCGYPAFPCHENGATVLQYAPKQQLIISGGRKGFVCIFDLRQRQLLHTFQAHDSAIKALALDASEDFFITGSAEGNMKVRVMEASHFTFHSVGRRCTNTRTEVFFFFLRTFSATVWKTNISLLNMCVEKLGSEIKLRKLVW